MRINQNHHFHFDRLIGMLCPVCFLIELAGLSSYYSYFSYLN